MGSLEERELFGLFHQLFDEYQANPPSPLGELPGAGGGSSLYYSRFPPNARQRFALRVQQHNAYYITGGRRPARLTTELERDFRWSVRTLRLNSGGRREAAATEAQIDRLPVVVLDKGERQNVVELFARQGCGDGGEGEEEVTECAICLSDFEAGDEITLLPCGHLFHLSGCVREWLRNHARTCPTCRADICGVGDSRTEVEEVS